MTETIPPLRVCGADTLTQAAAAKMPHVGDGLEYMEWDSCHLSDHLPVFAEVPVKGTQDFIKIVWWNVLNTKWVEYHHAKMHGGDRNCISRIDESSTVSTCAWTQAQRLVHIFSRVCAWIEDGYIVCLQEVGEDLLHHIHALPDLAEHHIDMENANGTNFNVTIHNTDNYKLDSLCVAVPRPIHRRSETDDRNPPAKTYASKFSKGELSFGVVNLHVEFKRLSLYMRCIGDMATDYPDLPFFVGGDFNAGCRDDHGSFEIRMDHIKHIAFGPVAHFVVPTGDWYTHCNVFRNVGRSSRQIDKFDYAMVWGDRDMLDSKLCIDFM